jgi:hypothetical protein
MDLAVLERFFLGALVQGFPLCQQKLAVYVYFCWFVCRSLYFAILSLLCVYLFCYVFVV